jgi:hypothetical protein
MTQQIVPDDAHGSVLFPEYTTLYDVVVREVEGLTDVQLDFTSDNWAWVAWSIRRQLSHMANLIYGWLLVRWGTILFPQDTHSEGDRKGGTTAGLDPRLDETPVEAPDKLVMTLEATFRHMYFEEITHLYNIQRLKRAQGLPTVVEVPRVGYWILDEWDRSEP